MVLIYYLKLSRKYIYIQEFVQERESDYTQDILEVNTNKIKILMQMQIEQNKEQTIEQNFL